MLTVNALKCRRDFRASATESHEPKFGDLPIESGESGLRQFSLLQTSGSVTATMSEQAK